MFPLRTLYCWSCLCNDKHTSYCRDSVIDPNQAEPSFEIELKEMNNFNPQIELVGKKLPKPNRLQYEYWVPFSPTIHFVEELITQLHVLSIPKEFLHESNPNIPEPKRTPIKNHVLSCNLFILPSCNVKVPTLHFHLRIFVEFLFTCFPIHISKNKQAYYCPNSSRSRS